tara:strand:+ start:425 stop:772 length:348 start_codon:yes stop_codon:yes gene_type:complete
LFTIHTRWEVIELNERSEDGERMFRDVYFLVAQNEDGFQFQSARSFQGWDIQQVRRDCAQFEKEVSADLYWADPSLSQMRKNEAFFEIRPAYGSEAYQRGNCEQELIDLERREDG